MRKDQMPAGLKVVFAAVGLLLVIPVLWVFVSVTAKPLHPSAASVPTTLHATPLPKWAGAVEHGRQLVRASVAEQNLPGLSVAIGIDGELVWAEGFGYADLKTSTPVTPEHRFRIGTASTVLTSAAAGLLLQDGRLKLDSDIQTYVPAFPRKQWPVTLRALMTHTAGLVPEGGDGSLYTKHCGPASEALQYFASNALQFKPGAEYRYSSSGWVLVSTAIEAAANQPFLTFMREQIFAPLAMRDTVPDPLAIAADDFPLANLVRELIHDPQAARDASPDSTNRPVQDRVTPYYTRFASDPNYGLYVMRPLDYSCYAGAGVFTSTPSDLVRFGMAMHSGKLLHPATVELLQAPQRLASGEVTGYGLGWSRKTVTVAGKPTRVIGQDGDSFGGMVASLMTFPDYGIVVAATSNISYTDTAAIGLKITEAFVKQGRISARQ